MVNLIVLLSISLFAVWGLFKSIRDQRKLAVIEELMISRINKRGLAFEQYYEAKIVDLSSMCELDEKRITKTV